jgi:hypothetical protein
MSENPIPDESLGDEFKNLGKNLSDLLRTAWDNPERKRVQQEIETSLNDLGNLIKREAESFSESPTGQRLKSDVEELGERVRSAETREKVRKEVLDIMKNANAELQKIIDRWSAPSAAADTGDEPPVVSEVDDVS